MASTRRAARGLARWVAAPRADAVERVGSNRSGASRAVAGVAHLQDRRREERSPARSRRRSFFSVPDLDAMRERVGISRWLSTLVGFLGVPRSSANPVSRLGASCGHTVRSALLAWGWEFLTDVHPTAFWVSQRAGRRVG